MAWSQTQYRFEQVALPGFPTLSPRPQNGARRRDETRVAPPHDELVVIFERRLVAFGASKSGMTAYRNQLLATLRAARRISGSEYTMTLLFQDIPLFGRALVDDVSLTGVRLSKWTLAQRRSAVRKFAGLMRPELLPLVGEEPLSLVDRALRFVAERVGGGFRLTGGSPRNRGGAAPTAAEITRLIDVLEQEPGFVGRRNVAFFRMLWTTGCRVNALRLLDGRDLVVMPDGRIRLYLHEKGKSEPREVELDDLTADALRSYLEAYKHTAASTRHPHRVHIGRSGAVWRSTGGRQWGYASIVSCLRKTCFNAGVPPFTPHAFRRAFATDGTACLPRYVVSRAGGWQGIERMDDHYIQVRTRTLWDKLNGSVASCPAPADDHVREATDAPAVPV